MEDINDYWKLMEYPPLFSNIDWNSNNNSNFEFNEVKVAPTTIQHVPFQRRRSSSVDLPINPLYLNSSRFMFDNETIPEEEVNVQSKVGLSSTLEFPSNNNSIINNVMNNNSYDFSHNFDFNFNFNHQNNALFGLSNDSPSLSTCSSTNNDDKTISSITASTPLNKQQIIENKSEESSTTYFPELHRTSYNTILGQQLKQHQKRRRSSSLPPVFHIKHQQKKPTPLIFTQIQVTDPTPVQHTQKPKIDAKPIAIERVVKKPQIKKPTEIDPAEKQKKLDQELIQLNFEDVTVAELKEMLKERGLSNTGKKAVLADRLKEARQKIQSNTLSQPQLSIPSSSINPTSSHLSPNSKPSLVQSSTCQQNNLTSPAIHAMANMSIHSPNVLIEDIYTTHDNNNDLQYQTLLENLNINDLLQFDPMVDDNNSILFSESTDHPLSPRSTIKQSPQQDNKGDPNWNADWTTSLLFPDAHYNPPVWDSEWDQDKLDHFLTELT